MTREDPTGGQSCSGGSEPTPNADALEDLVATILAGPREQLDERIAQACERHPGLATPLQQQMERLRELGFLPAAGASPPGIPEQIGPFVLLRRIGGGGMGIVYEAEELPHGRKVALKLVRPELLLFDDTRRRFLREVAVVGGLDHPNIVPVLRQGEDAGVPWYAMQLVRGRSLAAVLDQLQGQDPTRLSPDVLGQPAAKSYAHACCEIIRQIAGALAAAHQSGVIHRDVKPSNIMLAADGRALLIDFGLAHASGTESLTRTGVQPGSLAYMSPEQARGLPLDGRTDLFSLGVTLYQLLSLHCPFLAETAERIRANVIGTTPPPLRRRLRTVPWEVDAICATAMAPELSRRYATAEAFAADLEAFLSSRPIRARSAGPILRARRYVQRRPALVSAVTASVLLTVGLPLVLFVQQSKALTNERGLRQQADTARQVAEEQLTTQRQLAAFLGEIWKRGNPRERFGRLDMTVRQAVDAAIADLDGGHLRYQPAAEATIRMAAANYYIGAGNVQAASSLLERCWQLRTVCLPADSPELAEVAHGLGRSFRDLGLLERAEHYQRETVRIRKLEWSRGPWVAQALVSLAITLRMQQRPADAEAVYLEALSIYHERVGPDDENVAMTLTGLANLRLELGRLPEAEADCREAVRIFGQLHPDAGHLDKAHATSHLGRILIAGGRADEGEHLLRSALAMTRSLVGNADRQAIRQALALGQHLADTDRVPEGERLLRDAAEGAAAIGFADPEAELGLGELLLRTGRAGEAVTLLSQRLQRVVAQTAVHRVRVLLARARIAIADFAAAEVELQRAWTDAETRAAIPAREQEAIAGAFVDLYANWATADPGVDRTAATALWQRRHAEVKAK